MKTTDKKELKEYGTYYTRKGEVIILHDWGKGQNGKIYICSRYYEGESMTCALYPSGHTELSAPYEHETEPEIFKEIFKNVPMFVVDEEYKQKEKEVISLSKALGVIKTEVDKNKNIISETEAEFKVQASKMHNNITKIENLEFTISRKNEVLEDIKAKISKAEDRLSDLSSSSDVSTISKDELGYLRKTEFKMQCLESGGVDNWEWYSESLKEYNKRYP